jgi:hypothetical protein
MDKELDQKTIAQILDFGRNINTFNDVIGKNIDASKDIADSGKELGKRSDLLSGIIDNIVSNSKSDQSKGVIGAFQEGGISDKEGEYLVGENGPEIVNLPPGSAVIPLNIGDLLKGLLKFPELKDFIGEEEINLYADSENPSILSSSKDNKNMVSLNKLEEKYGDSLKEQESLDNDKKDDKIISQLKEQMDLLKELKSIGQKKIGESVKSIDDETDSLRKNYSDKENKEYSELVVKIIESIPKESVNSLTRAKANLLAAKSISEKNSNDSIDVKKSNPSVDQILNTPEFKKIVESKDKNKGENKETPENKEKTESSNVTNKEIELLGKSQKNFISNELEDIKNSSPEAYKKVSELSESNLNKPTVDEQDTKKFKEILSGNSDIKDIISRIDNAKSDSLVNRDKEILSLIPDNALDVLSSNRLSLNEKKENKQGEESTIFSSPDELIFDQKNNKPIGNPQDSLLSNLLDERNKKDLTRETPNLPSAERLIVDTNDKTKPLENSQNYLSNDEIVLNENNKNKQEDILNQLSADDLISKGENKNKQEEIQSSLSEDKLILEERNKNKQEPINILPPSELILGDKNKNKQEEIQSSLINDKLIVEGKNKINQEGVSSNLSRNEIILGEKNKNIQTENLLKVLSKNEPILKEENKKNPAEKLSNFLSSNEFSLGIENKNKPTEKLSNVLSTDKLIIDSENKNKQEGETSNVLFNKEELSAIANQRINQELTPKAQAPNDIANNLIEPSIKKLIKINEKYSDIEGAFRTGGIVKKEGNYLVGENGPELVKKSESPSNIVSPPKLTSVSAQPPIIKKDNPLTGSPISKDQTKPDQNIDATKKADFSINKESDIVSPKILSSPTNISSVKSPIVEAQAIKNIKNIIETSSNVDVIRNKEINPGVTENVNFNNQTSKYLVNDVIPGIIKNEKSLTNIIASQKPELSTTNQVKKETKDVNGQTSKYLVNEVIPSIIKNEKSLTNIITSQKPELSTTNQISLEDKKTSSLVNSLINNTQPTLSKSVISTPTLNTPSVSTTAGTQIPKQITQIESSSVGGSQSILPGSNAKVEPIVLGNQAVNSSLVSNPTSVTEQSQANLSEIKSSTIGLSESKKQSPPSVAESIDKLKDGLSNAIKQNATPSAAVNQTTPTELQNVKPQEVIKTEPDKKESSSQNAMDKTMQDIRDGLSDMRTILLRMANTLEGPLEISHFESPFRPDSRRV